MLKYHIPSPESRFGATVIHAVSKCVQMWPEINFEGFRLTCENKNNCEEPMESQSSYGGSVRTVSRPIC